ncbi:MAG TPA: hypothetical protein VHM27_13745 [Rhizomicrobium sp.]|nr:hypothetical protein [Rhizomicrobium sp.]
MTGASLTTTVTTGITTGQAGLCLLIVFCIAAIWAASGSRK